MGGGGKGGGGTVQQVQPTYVDPVTGRAYSSASQLNAAITAREQQEAAKAAADKAAAEAKAIADRNTFNTRLTGAYDQSKLDIENYFRTLGLDPTMYQSDILNTLNNRKQQVADLDPNPMATFGSNLGQSIVNQLAGGAQNRARTGLDQLFGSNYSARELPLELIDPVTNTVLGSQFDPLNTQLENAMKRRTLTDKGYAGALSQLENDMTAGRSTVSRLGTNVLMANRGDIDSYLSGAYNSASTLPLASANMFDPNSYYNEAESRTERYRQNLHGDILNALGSTKLSDITRLLNAGGVAQGATDPTATNPNAIPGGAVSDNFIAQQILQNRRRGLGSQGQF